MAMCLISFILYGCSEHSLPRPGAAGQARVSAAASQSFGCPLGWFPGEEVGFKQLHLSPDARPSCTLLRAHGCPPVSGSAVGIRDIQDTDNEIDFPGASCLVLKPGITGLWAIPGRDLDWSDYRRLDIYYAENWSPVLDVTLMVRVLRSILRPHY